MNLNLIAPINVLGYGYTGLHICDELVKLGHEVALFPVGKPYCHPRHEAAIKQALQNADHFDVTRPCIRLWHQHDMSMFVGHGKHIGFPIFELDTFTEKEKHHLRSCDEVWTCSDWGRGILQQNIQPSIHEIKTTNIESTQLRTVPLGVDSEIFYPTLSKRSPTIFLNVGKWETRKGHYELIKAFNLAFEQMDNVELWMMCDNPFLKEEQTQFWINRCKDSNMGHKIRIIPRVEVDTEVAEIMQQADCGVFPSRAEGWNLEALEMLSCGKQVIATDYSAHTEFLTDANAWLVPINGLESAYDGIWFHNQGNWGQFDDTSMEWLVAHMQMVHEYKKKGELGLNERGIETAKKYSWKNTASTIVQHLS